MGRKANFRAVNFRTVQYSSGLDQRSECGAVSLWASQEDITMTDISNAAPIIIRRLKLPQLVFRRLAIGATFNAMALLISKALDLTYVQPYSGLGRCRRASPEDELDDRDPSW